VGTLAEDLIIFCPDCDRLILAQASCGTCGWRRPPAVTDPGGIVWQSSLPGRLAEPYTLPALSGDLLLVGLEPGSRSGTRQGTVLALESATGRQRWCYYLSEGQITHAPVAAGPYILLASQDINSLPKLNNALIALNRDGELAWRHSVPAHSLSIPAVCGDRLFFATSSSTGYIVALADGRLHHQVNNLPAWIPAQPAVGENTFYLGAAEPVLTSVTAAEGHRSLLFRAENDDAWFSLQPAFAQGILYAGCSGKELYAIETPAGRLRWQLLLGRGLSSAPVVGEHLYIGVKERSEKNHPAYALYALELATGEEIWRFQSDGHFEAPVLVDGGMVYAGTRNGRFYALDAHTGAVHWQLEWEHRIVTAPVIAGDNLIIGTREGNLVAVACRYSSNDPELLPADIYRAQGDWRMAGISAALAGDWLAAAADFERLDKPSYAAELYERAAAWQQAGDNYRRAGEPHQAITAYRKAGSRAGEAAVLLERNDFVAAARLYESATMYVEAAAAYGEAGLLPQAARCYAQAGELQQAAELYLALEEPAPAADLYRQLGDNDTALAILQAAGLAGAAAQILLAEGHYHEAAHLLEEAQLTADAAAIWLQQGEWQSAAQVYERTQQWSQAAEIYLQVDKLEEAASLYLQDNQLSRAAELYIRLKAPQEALALYRQIEDATEVARLAEQNEDWWNAANAYLIMQPPRPLEAARCWRLAGEWAQAAQLFAEAGDLNQAVPLWLQAGQPVRAAGLLLDFGRSTEAAQLWEDNGRYEEAAAIRLQLDEVEEAIRLYEQAGNRGQVLDLIESRGEWHRSRELARQWGEYEREALAIVRLIESAQPREMMGLHLSAAQAFKEAAESAELQKQRQVAEIVALWEEAAAHYEHAIEPEKAAECSHNINRLCHWPDLLVQITAEQTLVAGEWHMLTAKISNVGFGAAMAIMVRVHSENFSGDDMTTQRIPGLRGGQELKLTLRVLPKRKAIGLAVPLNVEVAYLRPDRTQVRRNIRGHVAVRRPDSPVTPVLPGRPVAEMPGLEIYGEQRSKLHSLLMNHFSPDELRHLCFALNVPYDDLEAGSRTGKARELIIYLERRGRVDELIALCRQERPHLTWE
jgi:eukaryotic-like serine/threonine-protein kinase